MLRQPIIKLAHRRSAALHHTSNAGCRSARVLVFPNSNDLPTRSAEPPPGVQIAGLVASDLVWPVPTIDLVVADPVPRAAMPEATIDEDCHPRSNEDDVNSTSSTRNNRAIEPVAQAQSVECLPQRDLRCCVAFALKLHASAHTVRTGVRARRPD